MFFVHLIPPLVVGIIAYFTYMTFELFVRKQERISLIEKMGQNLTPFDASLLKSNFRTALPAFQKKSFTSLRIGCLFLGFGLGLLIGLFISLFLKAECGLTPNSTWAANMYSIAYIAPVLLFGGLGLVISYLIESKSSQKKEN